MTGHPILCRFCGADTLTAGYTYGACSACIKSLINRATRDNKREANLIKFITGIADMFKEEGYPCAAGAIHEGLAVILGKKP